MEETWKAIPGFAWYQASTQGRIRSIERVIDWPNRSGVITQRPLPSREIRPCVKNSGYLTLTLAMHGKRYTSMVHHLVASAFIGERPSGSEVNHIDGDKKNNSPGNLEYVTPKDNMRHAREIGIWDNRGEKNGQAKATEDQIRDAHYIVSCGISRPRAAEITGLTESQVTHAVNGTKWRHLGLPVLVKSRKKSLAP